MLMIAPKDFKKGPTRLEPSAGAGNSCCENTTKPDTKNSVIFYVKIIRLFTLFMNYFQASLVSFAKA